MLKYVKVLVIFMFLACLSVNADTTYIRGNIAPSTKNVAVRTCAKEDCPYVKSDTNISISIDYPEMFEILGEEGNFYKIRLQYSGFWYTGFVLKSKDGKELVQKQEYTITDALVNEFLTMGFDMTYAEKLAKLKVSHPNWTFTPYEVNATWDEVIAGETKYISTNLINGSNINLRNTGDGAYSNGVWTEFEGGGWYSASHQVVKYYVDPRNFLNDGHVFMFERLSYDETTQTEEAINSMLVGTFMEGNTFYYNENNEKVDVSFAKAFIDSGITNGVSSVHLVSRVIQEQGTKGSALSSGDNATYPGYYNFFNIRATGKTSQDVILNGLAYAKSQNWNSPYASIVGGGKLLQSYLKAGQDTLYLQKFDFAGSTYYTNQYMQNIRAPYTESYRSYKAYVQNNLLESSFNFSIPIFKGVMPSFTSLSDEYNEDTSLGLLNITGCNLMPSFTPSAYNYSCTVSKETEKVTVTAETVIPETQIEGTGEIELKEDKTEISIIVTAKSGDKGEYKVTIYRNDDINLSPDEILAKLQINNNSGYLSGFIVGTEASSLNKTITDSYPSATSEISKDGILSTGMTLKLKNNGESTYNIIIFGDANGDGEINTLDLLSIQKHLLNIKALDTTYIKASDVNKDNTVDTLDLLSIQKDILNIKKISQ